MCLYCCSTALTFTPWHIEAKGIGAMNHMVWGAPKLWLLTPNREVCEKLEKLLEEKYKDKWKQQLYGKNLSPHHVSLQEALGCGMVPFVQQPNMVVYTQGVSGVHVTTSSGISMAIASNCFFGKDLKEHLDVFSEMEPELNKGNHEEVGDALVRCLKLF